MFNEKKNEFKFHPEWYIASARYQYQFEEKLARTQLFLDFVERRKNYDSTEMNAENVDDTIVILMKSYIEKEVISRKA